MKEDIPQHCPPTSQVSECVMLVLRTAGIEKLKKKYPNARKYQMSWKSVQTYSSCYFRTMTSASARLPRLLPSYENQSRWNNLHVLKTTAAKKFRNPKMHKATGVRVCKWRRRTAIRIRLLMFVSCQIWSDIKTTANSLARQLFRREPKNTNKAELQCLRECHSFLTRKPEAGSSRIRYPVVYCFR